MLSEVIDINDPVVPEQLVTVFVEPEPEYVQLVAARARGTENRRMEVRAATMRDQCRRRESSREACAAALRHVGSVM